MEIKKIIRYIIVVLACDITATAQAAEDSFVAKLTPTLIGPGGEALQMITALTAVLILFIISMLLFKKFGLTRFNNNGDMKIVSQLSLGQKDRVILLDVGGTQLLIGVTQNNINQLHVFDEAIIRQASNHQEKTSFISHLNRYIRQRSDS